MAGVITAAKRAQYATGYVQLGMYREAARELEAVAAADRWRPEVMAARIELHRETGDWAEVRRYALRLLERDAADLGAWISLGCAVRRVENVAAARDALLQAEACVGKGHAIVHYNLACYYCLLGDRDEARRRLAEACRLEEHFKRAAQDDPDLEDIRERAPGESTGGGI